MCHGANRSAGQCRGPQLTTGRSARDAQLMVAGHSPVLFTPVGTPCERRWTSCQIGLSLKLRRFPLATARVPRPTAWHGTMERDRDKQSSARGRRPIADLSEHACAGVEHEDIYYGCCGRSRAFARRLGPRPRVPRHVAVDAVAGTTKWTGGAGRHGLWRHTFLAKRERKGIDARNA